MPLTAPLHMAKFFREYWLWILLPFVIVFGGLAALYFLAGGESTNDFVYPVF